MIVVLIFIEGAHQNQLLSDNCHTFSSLSIKNVQTDKIKNLRRQGFDF